MPSPRRIGLSLLVVEDDPLLRRQAAAVLEQLGADVTGASDLRAARRLVCELDFDFVLLDLNLPDGDGLELLKERLFPLATGVIVMTAHSHVGSVVEAMRLGAVDYLVKPFRFSLASSRCSLSTLRLWLKCAGAAATPTPGTVR